MNFREHSESSTVDSLKFEVKKQEHGFTLIPKAQDDHCIRIAFSGGELIERDYKYICDLEAQTEVDNEVPGLDCAFCPYDVSVDIPASASMHFSVMCDIVPPEACNDNSGTAFAKHLVSDNESAFEILRAQLDYTDELANLYGVTGLDNRVGGSADVHSQGNDHRVGLGELLEGQMLRVFLILRGMDAAVEALVWININVWIELLHCHLVSTSF